MEWVETTGRTVDEAKEAALDELGVDEADAEFEVLAEAQTGLFGRLRNEARVRARVRPTAPRPKEDRRDRRRRSASTASTAATEADPSDKAPQTSEQPSATAGNGSKAGATRATRAKKASAVATAGEAAPIDPAVPSATEKTSTDPAAAEKATRQGTVGARTAQQGPPANGDDRNEDRSKGNDVEVALEEQARIAEAFLTRLTGEFGLDASIDVVPTDEESVELQISGPNLGLLIGQKGATLVALQSLTRTVVQHKSGATNGHLNVDVGGYRQKRTEALVRFANEVASTVLSSRKPAALEPMSALDRKIVHDTVASISGVATISEGEEPQRRVVVRPDPTDD